MADWLASQPLLLIGVAVLALGPLLFHWVQRRPGWMALTDSFVFVVIAGLVLFHVLPELIDAAGWPVLPLVLIGMIGPSLMEKLFTRAARSTHLLTLALGVLGLCLHEFTDGAALIGEGELHLLVALSIILHRVPVSLTVWWLLRPAYGRRLAVLVLAIMMVATLAGGIWGSALLSTLAAAPLALFQAFVVGSILHVVFHRPHLRHPPAEARTAEGIGSLLGVAAVVLILLPHWIGHGHDHGHPLAPAGAVGANAVAALDRFIDLAATVAPALLAAYMLAWLIHYFFPTTVAMRARGGSDMREALRGALLGLPLPVCIPSVTKLQPLLQQAGASHAFTLAFMVASPILGFDAVLVSLALLGLEVTLARLLLAVAVALAAGYFAGRLCHRDVTAAVAAVTPAAQGRLSTALRAGYSHLIDHTAPWILFGLVVAATLAPTPGWALLADAPWWTYVLILALALPVHWCATGVTPVVAVLLAAGLPLPAALVFLLVGPATSLGLLQFVALRYNRSAAVVLLLVVVTVALAGALLYPVATPFVAPMQDIHPWQYGSAALLLVLIAVSLFRQGARAFAAELMAGIRLFAHDHHHCCGHTHGHDHGRPLAPANAAPQAAGELRIVGVKPSGLVKREPQPRPPGGV